MDEEKDKALENAANAMNEAAEADAPKDAPEEKPINAETSAAMDALLSEEDAPKTEEKTEPEVVNETPATPEAPAENPAGEMKEPAVEPAPAVPATPSPVPFTEAVKPTTPAPEQSKKSKKGLIIGLAAGAVAVLGIGGFAVAYSVDTKPENIAMSAVADLLSSKTISVTGVLDLKALKTAKDCNGSTTKCGSVSEFESAKLTLEEAKDDSNETSTNATLEVVFNGKTIKLSLGTVYLKDHTIYIKMSGLKAAVNEAMSAADDTEFDKYATLYQSLIEEIVGAVDDVWWKINVPELIDEYEDMAASTKDAIKAEYQCAVDTVDKIFARQDKYVDIYKKNTFITLEEYKGDKKPSSKGTPYTVKLDAKKLTSFSNEMAKEADDLGFTKCIYESQGRTYQERERVEVKEEDVADSISDFPEVIVTVENGFFSHTLTGLYYSNTTDVFDGYLDLTFSKKSQDVSAPAGAKDAKELITTITDAVNNFQATIYCKTLKIEYPTYYNTYCDAKTDKLKPQYQELYNS